MLTELVNLRSWCNRPFPSSKKSHSQNEAKCETFVVKMSFICIIIKNHFHINSFALSLALKVRFFGTRKWPIFSSLQSITKEIWAIKHCKIAMWQNFNELFLGFLKENFPEMIWYIRLKCWEITEIVMLLQYSEILASLLNNKHNFFQWGRINKDSP